MGPFDGGCCYFEGVGGVVDQCRQLMLCRFLEVSVCAEYSVAAARDSKAAAGGGGWVGV